jgi:hypothetical protein
MEGLGSKPKFWFTYSNSDNKGLFLFKADNRGTGEDWAEVVSCGLCRLLGIPHVHYDIAFHEDLNLQGVICRSFIPHSGTQSLANELLLRRDPSYPKDRPRYKAERHTIEAAVDVLRTLKPPTPDWCVALPRGIESALDIFTGYLMLDAWIANQDRHHENWGAIFLNNEMRLAPTFDHGAALARNITDDERQKRMKSQDDGYKISAFARKAKSAFYSKANPKQTLTTHDAWLEIAKYAPDAASIWLKKLRAVDDDMVRNVLYEVPAERMTDIGREFTVRLLHENRSLLLESMNHE